MSKGFSVSETIELPAARVWQLITDPSLMPRWMKGIDEMQPLDEGPLDLGSRLSSRLSVTGRGKERETRIDAWEPISVFALASKEGGVSAVYRYRLEPDGERTRVTLDARCTASGFPWRLLHPLISFAMKRVDGGQLAAFKDLAESLTD